ncbi:HEPN domain-containing protein [Methylophilus sp. TWE2]|uniref:HEPN domain-containing protein n=1 Tax=Methylophilus sp. TWE2 TaxID=1662285 RepID=UPI0006713E0A|nr:HEPN domain-containing protein [Methylophilus sp. TWE2]AKR43692.1 hypothetical protein ACJ67_09815 [Methylophilus sp. TWE2]
MTTEKIKLHQGQINCLRDFIKSFEFKNESLTSNDYLSFQNLEESLLKNKVLQEHFDKHELGFFIQRIADDFVSEKTDNLDEKKKLYQSDDWLNLCLERVVNLIQSTPLEYTGSISFPACRTRFPVNISLNSRLSIDTPHNISYPNSSLVTALLKISEHSIWQTDLLNEKTYLNLKVHGYCDGSINCTASIEFLSLLKQFLALAMIQNLLVADKWKLSLQNWQEIEKSDKKVTPHWVMKTTNSDQQKPWHMEVPPELAAFINVINFNSNDLSILSDCKNTKSASITVLGSLVQREPENALEFNEALLNKFKIISTFFSTETSFDKERISAALEWYLEAKSSNNQSVSLIYFCIGLEAILSDGTKSRELGLKEKLGDRVAYMIGNTQEERKKWKDKFEKIYEARSNLVHAKQPRLSKHDQELLRSAEVILEYLIERELNGLLKSLQKKKPSNH